LNDLRSISQGTVVWYLMRNTYLTPKLREGETVDLSLYSPRERTNIRLYGLDFKDATPADIFEYKTKWSSTATEVSLRGGLDKATRWCRTHCFQQDFKITKYAKSDDSHAIYFKNAEEAMLFRLSN
jgi:hypothetical protein